MIYARFSYGCFAGCIHDCRTWFKLFSRNLRSKKSTLWKIWVCWLNCADWYLTGDAASNGMIVLLCHCADWYLTRDNSIATIESYTNSYVIRGNKLMNLLIIIFRYADAIMHLQVPSSKMWSSTSHISIKKWTICLFLCLVSSSFSYLHGESQFKSHGHFQNLFRHVRACR